MALDRRYWDSDAFLGYLRGEPDKISECESVLEAAEDRRLIIVTSALTLAEVLYVKGKSAIPKEDRDKVSSFFKQPYISVQNVTRRISEYAREVFWDYGIRPKDAIHVATAVILKVPVLNSFDKVLLGADSKIGNPPLRIQKPHEPGQRKFTLEVPKDSEPS
jgi:predicted nucleic acid-binding protein